jgi:hypothetical protein
LKQPRALLEARVLRILRPNIRAAAGGITMTVLRCTLVAFFLCSAFTLCLSGQERKPKRTDVSCREFVQEFYSWYLANASKDQERDGGVALKHRSYLFSPAIVRALREDDEAQIKAGSDLVSLDGDPFVGGDGLGEGYIVEKVTVTNGRCWAEVHAVWDGKKDETPDVTSELVIKNGKWLFVNFFFPSPSDPKAWNLLGALKALREGEKQ